MHFSLENWKNVYCRLFQNLQFLHSSKTYLEKFFEELMKQGFQFNHNLLQSDESSTTTVISSIECDALKYVAGYVCRKVCTQIKSSTINGKDSMVQFLSNFRTDDDSNEDDVEDDWIHRIDRGGLWHIGETMYMVFYIMEEEIRHHFTIELLPENEERKKKILSALYSNVDLQQQWEQLAMDYLEEKEKSYLLNQIICMLQFVDTHLPIRA